MAGAVGCKMMSTVSTRIHLPDVNLYFVAQLFECFYFWKHEVIGSQPQLTASFFTSTLIDSITYVAPPDDLRHSSFSRIPATPLTLTHGHKTRLRLAIIHWPCRLHVETRDTSCHPPGRLALLPCRDDNLISSYSYTSRDIHIGCPVYLSSVYDAGITGRGMPLTIASQGEACSNTRDLGHGSFESHAQPCAPQAVK